MSPAFDLGDAREVAARLIGMETIRWRHIESVATKAQRVGSVVPPQDLDLLVSAAWLHDIGYSPDIAITGFHPLDGARHLRSIGAPERLCSLVAFHSGAIVEARVRRLHGILLAEFEPEESLVADALTYADMTTSPEGEPVTVDQRITEILSRYEPGDPVHRAITESAPSIRAAVARVEAALGVAQPR